MPPRGGKRENSGRPHGTGQFGEPTVVIRVPESQQPVIKDFLATLKDRRELQGRQNVAQVYPIDVGGQLFTLPLYSSKVAAGFPSPADDHIEQRLSPDSYLVENKDATFCVRVKGESMIDAGIFDNDVLVVDRSRTAQVGDIVLAVLDGEFTVKTLGRSKAGARLIPANKDYPVIEVREHQQFDVWGVVTGSMRRFK